MKKSNFRIGLTNHSIAKSLQKNDEGFTVHNPIVEFTGINVNNVFHSLDNFVCRKGKYSVFMRIIHVDSGTIVQAVEPFVIQTDRDWYTYSYTIGWNYNVELAGLYEYQVFADGKKIGSFYFYQQEYTVQHI